MPRPKNKKELLEAANGGFQKLQEMISSLTPIELDTPFDFSADEKKKEAHWGRDKNLRDVLAHLYEWHRMLLRWVESNYYQGLNEPFLPLPYNWKTYGDLNVEFWKKHQTTSLEDISAMLNQTHEEVLFLAEKMPEEDLFEKGKYKWAGSSNIGSYFISTTSSHYDWAMKKLKEHKKKFK